MKKNFIFKDEYNLPKLKYVINQFYNENEALIYVNVKLLKQIKFY